MYNVSDLIDVEGIIGLASDGYDDEATVNDDKNVSNVIKSPESGRYR